MGLFLRLAMRAILAAIRCLTMSRADLSIENLAMRQSAGDVSTQTAQTHTHERRPRILGRTQGSSRMLGGHPRRRQTRHRDSLASSRISVLLAMEVQVSETRAPCPLARDPQSHQSDGTRQRLASTTNSKGARTPGDLNLRRHRATLRTETRSRPGPATIMAHLPPVAPRGAVRH